MQPAPPQTFHDLYQAHVGYVWSALGKLGVRRNELEDVTQDVFVRAYRSYSTYDPQRALRPWLFAIAARTAIDHRRQARHGRELLTDADEPHDDAPRPDAQAASAEDRRLLQELLGSLDDDARSVLVMYECLGHTAPEIAEALGIPLNTAYSRLRLARARFADLVQQRLGKETP